MTDRALGVVVLAQHLHSSALNSSEKTNTANYSSKLLASSCCRESKEGKPDRAFGASWRETLQDSKSLISVRDVKNAATK